MKKQTKDALQAELSNTLRRRKPVVIDEPPKYEYPIYDEPPTFAMTKANESSTPTTKSSSPLTSSSIINNSDKESINNNNKNVNVQPTVKPPNVNAILSVVTGIKIPANIQFDTNNGINKTTKPTTTMATTTTTTVSSMNSTTDKPPKISHGKPNFIINRNDSASALIKQIEKDSVKPNEHKIVHVTKFSAPNKKEFQSTTVLSKPKLQTMNSVPGIGVDKFKPVKSAKPSIPADTGNDLKSYGEVSSTLKKFNAMKSKPMDAPISTSNRISFVPVNNLVANKKALFEQHQLPIEGEKSSPVFQTKKLPVTKTYSHNDVKPSNNAPSKVFAIHQNLNRTASAHNYQRSAFDSVSMSLNKNAIKTIESTTATPTPTPVNVSEHSKVTTNGDTDQNGLIGYSKQMSTLHSTKSIDTKNFEQKTVVSFSKDLLNAPNMFPEQIRVVKKATITTETHHFTNNGIESAANFQNIRFSIGPNAQVVPKKK